MNVIPIQDRYRQIGAQKVHQKPPQLSCYNNTTLHEITCSFRAPTLTDLKDGALPRFGV